LGFFEELKMGRLIFITGGARSGKSAFAQKLANRLSKKVTYIATAQARDKEMELKIKFHRKNRPPHWKTIEREKGIAEILPQVAKKSKVILLDCLTILISNLLLNGRKNILKEIRQLVNKTKKIEATVLIVSNEVGMSIVPDNKLARRFRDIAGRANQIVAQVADEVYLVIAGIPVKLEEKNK
jgi:adenosylcobinamide kinase/adenosylcobinamide-phosphate guanylyltransferase